MQEIVSFCRISGQGGGAMNMEEQITKGWAEIIKEKFEQRDARRKEVNAHLAVLINQQLKFKLDRRMVDFIPDPNDRLIWKILIGPVAIQITDELIRLHQLEHDEFGKVIDGERDLKTALEEIILIEFEKTF